jgi:hypothetical protein
VVAGIGCHVPANVERGAIENRAALLAKCYRCGDDVCRDVGCSHMAKLPRRRVRMCMYCLEEIDRFGS